jgi:hypothetical protein
LLISLPSIVFSLTPNDLIENPTFLIHIERREEDEIKRIKIEFDKFWEMRVFLRLMFDFFMVSGIAINDVSLFYCFSFRIVVII